MTGSLKEAPKKPLLVAYSGFVDDDIRQKGKEAGFDIVIEAPLTQEKIKEVLKVLNNKAKHLTMSLIKGHKGYNKIPELNLEESKEDASIPED